MLIFFPAAHFAAPQLSPQDVSVLHSFVDLLMLCLQLCIVHHQKLHFLLDSLVLQVLQVLVFILCVGEFLFRIKMG